MAFVIRKRNSQQLRSRQQELVDRLISAYSAVEGAPITRSDLRDLASMGCLSVEERELYDELHRIEMMLGANE